MKGETVINKRIYHIGTIQYFTYTEPKFLKRNEKTEQHYLIRNVKPIYAESKDVAIEKYKKLFYIEYQSIHGWGDWYEWSNGVSIEMYDKAVEIVGLIIMSVETTENFTYGYYRENMNAEDFKEWWFDNGRCNQIPE